MRERTRKLLVKLRGFCQHCTFQRNLRLFPEQLVEIKRDSYNEESRVDFSGVGDARVSNVRLIHLKYW